nr:WecB/TagA/CpsF family glycosyltransferase [uncultured Desulfobacter sp.]
MKVTDFIGFKFNDMSVEELLENISLDTYKYVVTPNIDHVVRYNKNNESLNEIYGNSSVTLCDSKIIQLLSILFKKKIKHVIPGSSLTALLFEKIINQTDRVCIIGSDSKDVAVIKDKYRLKKLYHMNPPMGFINDDIEIEKVLQFVKGSAPDYIFLAIGSPRQEIIAYFLKEHLEKGLSLCIGASIDFIAGSKQRAPDLWQNLRLEWLYRFLKEPKRLFKRYFIDSWAIFPILYNEIRKS